MVNILMLVSPHLQTCCFYTNTFKTIITQTVQLVDLSSYSVCILQHVGS